MSVTIPTVYVYNIKTRTILTKSVDNINDKWIGNGNTDFEKCEKECFRRQFKL